MTDNPANPTLCVAFADSTLGRLLVAGTPQGLCALLIGDDQAVLRADLARRFPQAIIEPATADFEATLAQVALQVEQPQRSCSLPLHVRGTAFQQRVWQALRAIAPGQTRSYTQIAAQIQAPRAYRAVAQACGANPLAVVIPCHRVVGSDGRLSGYRWGVERKAELLRREHAA